MLSYEGKAYSEAPLFSTEKPVPGGIQKVLIEIKIRLLYCIVSGELRSEQETNGKSLHGASNSVVDR
jgi:hypothetical protein